MTLLLKTDLHCHTIFSHDSLLPVEKLIAIARKRGLDKIAITDHNTIRGAMLAKSIAPEFVIIGEEILTTRGEILAFFVTEEIPARLEPNEVIKRLRDQGAFISVSHPFDLMRHGWPLPDLEAIAPYVDAIETFNSRCMSADINDQACQYAIAHGLLGTVGSDAHSKPEIGKAYQLIPSFSDSAMLKTALVQAEVHASLSSPFIHLTSTWAKICKNSFPHR
jgi:predicted metal-dependent phosphoesterase TrpH